MNDVEAIWRETLQNRMRISPDSYQAGCLHINSNCIQLRVLQEYSVILVIPDLWDRFYVHDLVNMLLVNMGFKQIVCQQVMIVFTKYVLWSCSDYRQRNRSLLRTVLAFRTHVSSILAQLRQV